VVQKAEPIMLQDTVSTQLYT